MHAGVIHLDVRYCSLPAGGAAAVTDHEDALKHIDAIAVKTLTC